MHFLPMFRLASAAFHQPSQYLTMTRLQFNGQAKDVNVPDNMPLLWVLRDELGMTGTKFGCGLALCGACTVHMDGQPLRACVPPISAVAGRDHSTIDGMETEIGRASRRERVCQSVEISLVAGA